MASSDTGDARTDRPAHLFVVSGPAGAGKGTIVSQVCARMPNLWLSISATTRPPRGVEKDGVDYVFLSDEEFSDKIAEGDFLEWADVHGHRYGTLRSAVSAHLEAGECVLLEIDVQGAFKVKDAFPDARLIFIAPPSFKELERRLRARNTDDEAQIELRLDNAVWEMSMSARYNITIVNDDLDEAVDEVVSYIVHV